jgi:hypothetical protein
MAQPAIAPIIPNLGNQEAAVAGSQAIAFTATDRKLIEERGGTIDKSRSFLSILKEKPLTPQVENEETNIKPELNPQEFAGRVKAHKKMLKHSVLINPQERVKITNKLPDEYQASETPVMEPVTTTPAVVKLEPSLSTVKSKIKRYQLERLFTDDEQEFIRLSEAIRQETLTTARPESKSWLEDQLKRVTADTAEYKLKLLNSLDSIEHDTHHKQMISWLTKTIRQLATA